LQVFNPRSGLCDDQKNVEGCEETYPDEPRELDIEVGEIFTSLQVTLVRFLLFIGTTFVSLLGHTFLVWSLILIDLQYWLTGHFRIFNCNQCCGTVTIYYGSGSGSDF
jgi:hypothetical protein